jgi:hypothetical protein
MYTITLTEKRYTKNPNTKTTYILDSEKVIEVTEEQHRLTTNDETCKFFRRLGGSESKEYAYTFAGYKVVKLTSLSPTAKQK